MFIFVAARVCIACVCLCVCTYWEYVFNFAAAGPGDTEPQQPRSWERRNLLGPESRLIWLPLTCTASQSTGDKMNTQMINPRHTIVACVSQPRDILTDCCDMASHGHDAHCFLLENRTQQDQRPNLPQGDYAAGIVPLTHGYKALLQ